MAQAKFTKTFIDSLKPAAEKGGDCYWDMAMPGFGVRVTGKGTKSYLIQYRIDGDSRRMTLGQHGRITLEDARREARKRLGEVAHGRDPARERQEKRSAPSMNELAKDYLERHAIPKKRPASVREDTSMIDNILLPKIASKKVNAVTRRDVDGITTSLKDHPHRANRVRALLSKMFSLAVDWGWRADNPVVGVEFFRENPRERWLNDSELQRLSEALAAHPNQMNANAVRLLILTGARKSEVLSAEWPQFDLEKGLWTKSAHFTKQHRLHHVPLSLPVMRLLQDMSSDSRRHQRFLFPARIQRKSGEKTGPEDNDKPMQDIKHFWQQVRRSAGLNDVRLHDLRHTYASHLASDGVSLTVIGKLLGHTQMATTQRYAHLALGPQRDASDMYGEKLTKLTSK